MKKTTFRVWIARDPKKNFMRPQNAFFKTAPALHKGKCYYGEYIPSLDGIASKINLEDGECKEVNIILEEVRG